ncbi:hypothetical protein JMUB5695_01862 [Mycobacterium heckeshornense]|nr:hypothetical protein JMUB5695_01862 [Mycobacterium heckeshornense]
MCSVGAAGVLLCPRVACWCRGGGATGGFGPVSAGPAVVPLLCPWAQLGISVLTCEDELLSPCCAPVVPDAGGTTVGRAVAVTGHLLGKRPHPCLLACLRARRAGARSFALPRTQINSVHGGRHRIPRGRDTPIRAGLAAQARPAAHQGCGARGGLAMRLPLGTVGFHRQGAGFLAPPARFRWGTSDAPHRLGAAMPSRSRRNSVAQAGTPVTAAHLRACKRCKCSPVRPVVLCRSLVSEHRATFAVSGTQLRVPLTASMRHSATWPYRSTRWRSRPASMRRSTASTASPPMRF